MSPGHASQERLAFELAFEMKVPCAIIEIIGRCVEHPCTSQNSEHPRKTTKRLLIWSKTMLLAMMQINQSYTTIASSSYRKFQRSKHPYLLLLRGDHGCVHANLRVMTTSAYSSSVLRHSQSLSKPFIQ